ncbi:hypothetical protein [Caulobacter sp. Root1455]|nr:hypothetical protein [Caulobacter sp. Root1455]
MIDQLAQRLAASKVIVGQDDVALVLQDGDQGQEVVGGDFEGVERI